MFVLGGVIVELGYATGEMAEQVKRFKMDLFGRDDSILHTADIARNRNGFPHASPSSNLLKNRLPGLYPNAIAPVIVRLCT